MAGSAVSLETGVFHNNTNPVILDGACTHIMFNHPGHFVNLRFQINGYMFNLAMTQELLREVLVLSICGDRMVLLIRIN